MSSSLMASVTAASLSDALLVVLLLLLLVVLLLLVAAAAAAAVFGLSRAAGWVGSDSASLAVSRTMGMNINQVRFEVYAVSVGSSLQAGRNVHLPSVNRFGVLDDGPSPICSSAGLGVCTRELDGFLLAVAPLPAVMGADCDGRRFTRLSGRPSSESRSRSPAPVNTTVAVGWTFQWHR